MDEFAESLYEWRIELIRLIHQSGSDFKSCGVLIVVCTAAALYEFGRSKSGEPLFLSIGGDSEAFVCRVSNALLSFPSLTPLLHSHIHAFMLVHVVATLYSL